jgi:competence protein ComEA
MPAPLDQFDPHRLDHLDHVDELPPRPPPPLTWRERVEGLVASAPSSGRLLAALVAVVVVAAVGWRLTAAPAAPPEMEIPFAEQPGAAGASGGAGAGAPAGDAPAGNDPTGGATTGPGPAQGTAGDGPGAAAETAGATGGAGTEVVVHVVGAVAAPGVQRLPTGSRVVDALEAAGGAGPDADLTRINLAAPLTDGQQIHVLRIGEPPPPAVGAPAMPGSAGDAAGGDAVASGGLVDINRATAAELEELPGVGPATAEAIIAHREQNGPFASVDELIDVRGIGAAKLEQLRPHAAV